MRPNILKIVFIDGNTGKEIFQVQMHIQRPLTITTVFVTKDLVNHCKIEFAVVKKLDRTYLKHQ